jgi:hypothetical protein
MFLTIFSSDLPNSQLREESHSHCTSMVSPTFESTLEYGGVGLALYRFVCFKVPNSDPFSIGNIKCKHILHVVCFVKVPEQTQLHFMKINDVFHFLWSGGMKIRVLHYSDRI